MKYAKPLAIALATALFLSSCGQKEQAKAPTLEERVEAVLAQMTVEEKVALTHAQSKFSSAGVPRLGIPEVWCTDGPHGIRAEVLWDEWDQAGWTSDSCTAFPALTALAASWDPSLAELYGVSIGEEARYRKKDVLLGPGVNIYRTPLNGRNFEYMGEDPYLASAMVVPYVKGVQSNNVAACVKHYALNNQETARFFTDVTVDDRTLYEIYLPAFKAAVQEGGAWAIMGSYNLYKGQWNCHNQYLLNDILKGEWGFDGVVISDWGGVHDTDQAITNGLDMEFGSWTNGLTMGKTNAYDSYFLAQPYLDRIYAGKVGTQELDEKARRILRLIFRTSMNPEHKTGKFTSPEHYAAARKIGAEGIVLLKNEGGLLPLKDARKVLVVGENAVKMMTVGGGSSSLKAQHEVSPLDGLREALPGVEVVYERGYVGDASGAYNGVTTGQDLSEKRSAGQLIAAAVTAAQDADSVIFIGGHNTSDFQDAYGNDAAKFFSYEAECLLEDAKADGVHFYDYDNEVFTSKITDILFNRLRSGTWIAFMIELDPDGKLTGDYAEADFSIQEEEATEAFNQWLGSWIVSNGLMGYELTVSSLDNNYIYRVDGWERGQAAAFQMDQEYLETEFYAPTGYMYFTSQFLGSYDDENLGTVDELFMGNIFDSGGLTVITDEGLDLAVAVPTETGAELQALPVTLMTDNGNYETVFD